MFKLSLISLLLVGTLVQAQDKHEVIFNVGGSGTTINDEDNKGTVDIGFGMYAKNDIFGLGVDLENRFGETHQVRTGEINLKYYFLYHLAVSGGVSYSYYYEDGGLRSMDGAGYQGKVELDITQNFGLYGKYQKIHFDRDYESERIGFGLFFKY